MTLLCSLNAICSAAGEPLSQLNICVRTLAAPDRLNIVCLDYDGCLPLRSAGCSISSHILHSVAESISLLASICVCPSGSYSLKMNLRCFLHYQPSLYILRTRCCSISHVTLTVWHGAGQFLSVGAGEEQQWPWLTGMLQARAHAR